MTADAFALLMADIRRVVGPPPSPEELAEWDRRLDSHPNGRATVEGGATVEGEGHSRPSSEGRLSTRAKPSTKAKPSTVALEEERTVSTAAVVEFAKSHGHRGKLSKPEFVTWKLRLEVERGLRSPAPVGAPMLSDDVSPLARHVYERFLYLLACRWLHTPGAPAPFTRGFAAVWCQLSEKQARDAIEELRRLGAIRQVGEHEHDRGRTRLWLPGEHA